MIEGVGSNLLAGMPSAAPAPITASDPDAGAEPAVAAEFAAILAGWLTVAAPPPPPRAVASVPGAPGTTDEADAVDDGETVESGDGRDAVGELTGDTSETGEQPMLDGAIATVVGQPVPIADSEVEPRVEASMSEPPESPSTAGRSESRETSLRGDARQYATPEPARGGSAVPVAAASIDAVPPEPVVGVAQAEIASRRAPRPEPPGLTADARAQVTPRPRLIVPVPSIATAGVEPAPTMTEPAQPAATEPGVTAGETAVASPPALQRAVDAIAGTLERWGAALMSADTTADPGVEPSRPLPASAPVVEDAPDTVVASEAVSADPLADPLQAALRVRARGASPRTGEEGRDAAEDGAPSSGTDRSTPVAGFSLPRSPESAAASVQGPRGAGMAAPPEAPPSDAPPRMVTLRFDGPDGLEQRIRVAVLGDAVRATILTDGRSAAVMERALPDLHRSLAEHGFRDAQVGIRVLGAEAPVAIASRQEAAASGDPGRHRDDQAAPDGRRRESPGDERPRDRRHPSGEEAQR